jgi:hypothetical protein
MARSDGVCADGLGDLRQGGRHRDIMMPEEGADGTTDAIAHIERGDEGRRRCAPSVLVTGQRRCLERGQVDRAAIGTGKIIHPANQVGAQDLRIGMHELFP